MRSPSWYRSLYWRIAIGFVVLLAALLGAQGLAFMWLTGRPADLVPGRSPAEFAQSIASDLAREVTARPALDIDAYLNAQFRSSFRSFVVVTNDGRVVVSRSVPPPPMAGRATFAQLFGDVRPGDRGPFDRGDHDGRRGGRDGHGPADAAGFGDGRGPGDHRPGDGRGPGGGRGFADGRGGFDARGGPDGGRSPDGGRGPDGHGPDTPLAFAAVVVNGVSFGMVAVPMEPPPVWFVLRNVGPTLGGIALALLMAGTAIAALLVFRPTHRRLKSLGEATQALGAGRVGVRALVEGGDEVAALAIAFNDMASGLETRAAALAEADRTRRQLLADISHELMTPLAAIRGYVETLGMRDLAIDDPTRRRYLAIVDDESQRLEHIIGDLLELARLEGGGGALRSEPVAIASLLERLRHRHEPALEEKSIALELTQIPGLTVTGDANRLEQALQNLVANALRHAPEGGRIQVTADRCGSWVRLVVEDSGPGIPAEHLTRVFDRFYKVDESRAGSGPSTGSGLGLSIVQAIVQRHHGTISASNGAGGGARFEILLPSILGYTGNVEGNEPPTPLVFQ